MYGPDVLRKMSDVHIFTGKGVLTHLICETGNLQIMLHAEYSIVNYKLSCGERC